MPLFCDVALPVPLDQAFTYRLPGGMEPSVGARVLVPFRQQRMSGLVTELHDRKLGPCAILQPAPGGISLPDW